MDTTMDVLAAETSLLRTSRLSRPLIGADCLEGFYNCWARKEAIPKAGLNVRLDALMYR
jgi:phosphopantetheinyl transferase